MFTSRANVLNLRDWIRYFSFFERFCKGEPASSKTNTTKSKSNDGGGGKDVTINLENAYKLYDLEEEPSGTFSLNQKLATKFFTDMQTIRRLENACGNLYKQKEVRGFCHLCVGQEAVCAGIKSRMRAKDTIITSYRSHGWTWLMGVPIYALLAELCQKQTGCSRGKGGSMHTYAKNFFGGNGIVGAQVPLGTGIAFTHAYRCEDAVTFALYGDGAANQGQIYESFNMACLWKLPVVFVCENNKYGMGTSIQRSSCSTAYYCRGDFIPGLWVNGNDVLAVHNATEFAINYVKANGPLVVELQTYRYHGHSMSDPGTSYRNREEVKMMREKHDPITGFKNVCLQNKLLTEAEFKKIDDAIKKEVNDAIQKVRKDKESDLAELTTDVFAKYLGGNIRSPLKYVLKHGNKGKRLVPESVAKPTPKSEMKEVVKQAAKPAPKDDTKKEKKPPQTKK